MPDIRFGSRSDPGPREDNQDAVRCGAVCDRLPAYLVVADGMGGHRGGASASRAVVEAVVQILGENRDDLPHSESAIAALVQSIVHGANQAVGDSRTDGEEESGSTLALAFLTDSWLVAANIGDSRLYLIMDDGIEQLSEDHTAINESLKAQHLDYNEAVHSPYRHALVRSLGGSDEVTPHLCVKNLASVSDFRLVACTDGVTDVLTRGEILVAVEGADDPKRCADVLVERAIEKATRDNTTAAVLFFERVTEP